MLATLLESEAKRERSVAVTLLSVTAHTALIAAALYATAQARPERLRSPEIMRPLYFPSPKQWTSSAPSVDARQPVNVRPLVFVAPHLELQVPSIDITGFVTKPGDFSPNPIAGGGANQEDGPATGSGNAPFTAHQVERQASLAPGNSPPRYPEVLRSSGVEGRVMVEFIVDENGRAELASLRFLQSSNQLFEDAVRAALGRMRFVPARVGGRTVRQLVQMPFIFALDR